MNHIPFNLVMSQLSPVKNQLSLVVNPLSLKEKKEIQL